MGAPNPLHSAVMVIPGMATGGCGDVLSGIIGAFMAQDYTNREAAEMGVCLHAAAGDRAAANGEIGLLAGDLLPEVRTLLNEAHSCFEIEVEGEERQEAVGACLALNCSPPFIVYLEGDLGTGKTTLVRGFLRQLGYRGRVRAQPIRYLSPTTLRVVPITILTSIVCPIPGSWII